MMFIRQARSSKTSITTVKKICFLCLLIRAIRIQDTITKGRQLDILPILGFFPGEFDVLTAPNLVLKYAKLPTEIRVKY